jgi:hypothetical protein
MAAFYVVLVLLALAWPSVAAGAAAFIILGLVRLAGGKVARGTQPPSRWLGWQLSLGMALAAIASYGYGLARTTSLSMADAEDRCRIASPGTYDPDRAHPSASVQSLWPLHDTTCGHELVPGFVNPLVVAGTMLCLTFVGIAVAAKIRRARPGALTAER